MKHSRSVLVALLLGAGATFAQTTGGNYGTGTGAPSGNPTIELDLDLPVDAPKYVQQINVPGLKKPPVTIDIPTPPPPDDPRDMPNPDDPRDTPPPTIFGEEITSENDTVFYVIDHSGSMGWGTSSYIDLDGTMKSGDRMSRAKIEIIRSIMGLSMNFKFNIVAFDCYTLMWMNGMVPADDGNKQSAIAWVRALQPSGATGTGPATALALGDKQNMAVVLLTDGAPNCGANGFDGHRSMISSNNTQGATVNVFGIAASGDYRAFCQSVAGDSGGSYVDVP